MDVPRCYWCAKLVNYGFPDDVVASFADTVKPAGIHEKMAAAVHKEQGEPYRPVAMTILPKAAWIAA